MIRGLGWTLRNLGALLIFLPSCSKQLCSWTLRVKKATLPISLWKLCLIKPREYFLKLHVTSMSYWFSGFDLYFLQLVDVSHPLSTSTGSHRINRLMAHCITKASFLTWKCCVSKWPQAGPGYVGSLSLPSSSQEVVCFLLTFWNEMSLSMEGYVFKADAHFLPLQPLNLGAGKGRVGYTGHTKITVRKELPKGFRIVCIPWHRNPK